MVRFELRHDLRVMTWQELSAGGNATAPAAAGAALVHRHGRHSPARPTGPATGWASWTRAGDPPRPSTPHAPEEFCDGPASGSHSASLRAGASWSRLLSALVEGPGQFTVGFPGRRQIGVALFQGLGQLDVALLEPRDRSLEFLDVGGSAKARLASGLLAQFLGQALLQLLNACGQTDGAGLRVREIGLERGPAHRRGTR